MHVVVDYKKCVRNKKASECKGRAVVSAVDRDGELKLIPTVLTRNSFIDLDLFSYRVVKRFIRSSLSRPAGFRVKIYQDLPTTPSVSA